MSQFFNAQGLRLAFETHGSGEPLILIHGYPLTRVIWHPLLASLKGVQAILPDVRGFGESEGAAPGFGMEELAADVNALLDHLQIERAFLAGHSMGGYIALAFARRYPQRVKGLALIASQAAADPPERRAARLETAERIAREGVTFVAESMSQALTPDESLRPLLFTLIARQHPQALIAALHAMAQRPDSLAVLQSGEFPLLLVHGQADSLIPLARAQEIRAAVPRARLIELPGVGHVPMMEAPQRTAQALQAWIYGDESQNG
jgi:3-oxoadipate enol-lactonase